MELYFHKTRLTVLEGWLDAISDEARRSDVRLVLFQGNQHVMDQVTAAAQMQYRATPAQRTPLLETQAFVSNPGTSNSSCMDWARLIAGSPYAPVVAKLLMLASRGRGAKVAPEDFSDLGYPPAVVMMAAVVPALVVWQRESQMGHYRYRGIAARGLGQVIPKWFVGYWAPQALWRATGLQMSQLWPWPTPPETAWSGSDADRAWADQVLLLPYDERLGVHQQQTSRSQIDASLCMMCGCLLRWVESSTVPSYLQKAFDEVGCDNPFMRAVAGADYIYHLGSLREPKASERSYLTPDRREYYDVAPKLMDQMRSWAHLAAPILAALQEAL